MGRRCRKLSHGNATSISSSANSRGARTPDIKFEVQQPACTARLFPFFDERAWRVYQLSARLHHRLVHTVRFPPHLCAKRPANCGPLRCRASDYWSKGLSRKQNSVKTIYSNCVLLQLFTRRAGSGGLARARVVERARTIYFDLNTTELNIFRAVSCMLRSFERSSIVTVNLSGSLDVKRVPT